MMEDMSPSVAVTLGLGNPLCENLGISSKIEIKRIKLLRGTPGLMHDPALTQDGSKNSRWDTGGGCVKPETGEVSLSIPLRNGAKPVAPIIIHMTENGGLVHEVQESEEHETLCVGKDPSIMSGVELCSETLSPLAVEIRSIKNGPIVAKIISFEERNIQQKPFDDRIVAKQNEDLSFDEPTAKASVVTLLLSNERVPGKGGGVKSVFELDCMPLWGSVSICGHSTEMEDAVMSVPHFMKIPIKMFIGGQVVDGISRSLSHLTSHFYGVYDGHGGSQVANYCRDMMHLALEEEINSIEDNLVGGSIRDPRQVCWEKVFTNCFVNVDGEVGATRSRGVRDEHVDPSDLIFEPVAAETVGSTAVVAVVCSSHIVVANCGDSRAVLCRGKKQSHCQLIINQTERMNMPGLRHQAARCLSGMDTVCLVFLRCQGLLVTGI